MRLFTVLFDPSGLDSSRVSRQECSHACQHAGWPRLLGGCQETCGKWIASSFSDLKVLHSETRVAPRISEKGLSTRRRTEPSEEGCPLCPLTPQPTPEQLAALALLPNGWSRCPEKHGQDPSSCHSQAHPGQLSPRPSPHRAGIWPPSLPPRTALEDLRVHSRDPRALKQGLGTEEALCHPHMAYRGPAQ